MSEDQRLPGHYIECENEPVGEGYCDHEEWERRGSHQRSELETTEDLRASADALAEALEFYANKGLGYTTSDADER